MNIKFQTKSLNKFANNDKQGIKKLGDRRFKIFKRRLDQLKTSKNLEEVRNQPGRFHELTGTRKGQWACDLDHPYRLIFTAQENPIPIDNDGKYIWIEILGVEIIEIKDYH